MYGHALTGATSGQSPVISSQLSQVTVQVQPSGQSLKGGGEDASKLPRSTVHIVATSARNARFLNVFIVPSFHLDLHCCSLLVGLARDFAHLIESLPSASAI